MSTPAEIQRIRELGAAVVAGLHWTPGQLEKAAGLVLGTRILAARRKRDDEAA